MAAGPRGTRLMAQWLSMLANAVPWPFPVRPTLENLEYPDVRQALGVAFSEFGVAFLLLSLCIALRRGQVVAVLVLVTAIFLQAPNLELLLVDATPASYRTPPVAFNAATIAAGRKVFAANCVPCHGQSADGVGGLGDVADLRQEHIWAHPVGDLFWFVSHGIAADGDVPAMPAFESTLPEAARWSAIDYVYAMNAGAVSRGLDGWPGSIQAPDIPISCATLPARSIAGLRGKAIRVILGDLPRPLTSVPPVDGIAVVTVWIPGDEADTPAPVEPGASAPVQPGASAPVQAGASAPVQAGASAPGADCIARGGGGETQAWSILAGAADGHLVQARFLIDPNGVLRSVWRKDDGANWSDPARLLEEVRSICTEPLTIGGEHDHHH